MTIGVTVLFRNLSSEFLAVRHGTVNGPEARRIDGDDIARFRRVTRHPWTAPTGQASVLSWLTATGRPAETKIPGEYGPTLTGTGAEETPSRTTTTFTLPEVPVGTASHGTWALICILARRLHVQHAERERSPTR